MRTVSYPDVLAAFRELVSGRSRWPLRDYEITADLAVQLGLDERPDEALRNMARHAVTELLADGTLVALPRGGGGTWFFTPAARDVWEATRIRAQAEREQIRDRWRAVMARLIRAGYTPRPVAGTLAPPRDAGPVTLSLRDWEVLLDEREARRS